MLEAKLMIRLSKEEIFKIVSQERIMEYYLGIAPTNKLVTNPFRKDSNPGCSFYKSSKTNILYFRDWAKDRMWDCVSLVMEKYKIDYYRALYKIQIDIPKIKSNIPREYEFDIQEERLIQVNTKSWETDINYWLQHNITEDILKRYNVSPVSSVYLDKRMCMRRTNNNPIYAYHFPRSDKLKIYRPLTKGGDKWLSSTTSDDIYGWDHYITSRRNKHKLLFITSSCKDAMVINSFGFPSIAPIGEKILLKSKYLEILRARFKYIIVFMDNDESGLKSNLRYHQIYNLPYTFIPLEYKVKDISDFILKYKKNKTYKLIKKLIIETLRVRKHSISF